MIVRNIPLQGSFKVTSFQYLRVVQRALAGLFRLSFGHAFHRVTEFELEQQIQQTAAVDVKLVELA